MHFNLIHYADMKTISEGLRIGFFLIISFLINSSSAPGPGQLSQINHFFKKIIFRYWNPTIYSPPPPVDLVCVVSCGVLSCLLIAVSIYVKYRSQKMQDLLYKLSKVSKGITNIRKRKTRRRKKQWEAWTCGGFCGGFDDGRIS